MALCATSSYYEPQEIAARILPNVVVLTINPHSDVRSKAFQAVEQFLQIVKQYHEKTFGGDSNECMGSTISSLPGNASILGWAMNSLTTKGKPSKQTTQAMPPKSTSPLVSVVPTTYEEIEKDGWDDMLPLEDEKLPPALANIEAAQKRLVVHTKPQGSIPRPKSTSHVSKDAYDDLWGSITAPGPAPAPKLASRSSNLNVKAAAEGGSGSGCVVDEDDP
ncbi:unnamed protein product [Lactuca saligna]|uniref:Uncharacterized protein n=1 Tax=Lactuca saligna TaxID=75948 RepID=A0AA35VA42_LACSI|nr:unnamed protein product [Lactuca saligna]